MDKYASLERLRTSIINFLITILIFIVIVDPNNNIFYIKDIVFALIILFWAYTLFFYSFNIPRKIIIIFIFLIIIMPLYSVIIAYINGNVITIQAPYIKSFFFLLLLPVLINLNINITQRFHYIGFMISIIVLISLILFYTANDLFEIIYHYLVEDKQVAVSRGYEYQGYKMFNLFYKTSPLLLFPLGYYFQKLFFNTEIKKKKVKYIFSILLISVAFIFSSTRANIIIFFVLLIIYSMYYIFINNRKIFWFSIIFCFVCIIYLLTNILHQFSQSETSNSIKINHILDYINLFKSDTNILFWGQGFNSSFYSTYYNSYINVTELSYFEFIRIFGLPVTCIFITLLLYPVYIFYKNYKQYYTFRYIPISYLFYLIIAGTNPLLLSSTGMIVIVYVYSIMYLNSKDYIKSEPNFKLK